MHRIVGYRITARCLCVSSRPREVDNGDRRPNPQDEGLRDALASLIHERSYDSIVVNHILRRADVGRSAFYAHFENKDAMLASGIEHILEAAPPRESVTNQGPFGGAVSFSFPFFRYVGQCRHATKLTAGKRGRAVVHGHLRQFLVARLRQQFDAIAGRWKRMFLNFLQICWQSTSRLPSF